MKFDQTLNTSPFAAFMYIFTFTLNGLALITTSYILPHIPKEYALYVICLMVMWYLLGVLNYYIKTVGIRDEI